MGVPLIDTTVGCMESIEPLSEESIFYALLEPHELSIKDAK